MEEWRAYAACLTVDPELFFPVGEGPQALEQEDAAKAVCRSCDSIGSCLSWALSHREQSGVWGGWSEAERRGELRRRGKGRIHQATGTVIES